uniref:SAM_MT_RSMB_NOP domain-containing protein n=1 Tax=Steinernema glaseri TaxID=37863 RepID=A0A1I7ZRP1_9BILA
MDEHLYHETADIVNRTLSKERNLRTLVYNSSYANKKKLLRLCCETLKYRTYLEKLMKQPGVTDVLRDRAIQSNRTLLMILLYEFVIGSAFRHVPRKLAIAISTNQKAISQAVEELEARGEGWAQKEPQEAPVQIPRYARVNAIKWSMEEAEENLAKEQWVVQKMEDGTSPEVFRQRVAEMTEELVYWDPHIDYLLVFHPKTQIHNYWMVTEGYLILQDKASCLPAFLANPTPYTHVFDICSAPGMKTSHLAAVLNNQGKVWAIDKANDRFEVMTSMLERAGVTIASPFCGDFLKVDVTDKKFKKVKTAVVDPPCSGSGIVKRMDNLLGAEPKNERRLNGLHNLQVMILKHAMRLPNLERIVYSTCSVHEEEDESVLEEIVSDPNCPFELIDALPSWKHRGLSSYEFGEKCLRADPKVDLTNGFFVAVFERKQE